MAVRRSARDRSMIATRYNERECSALWERRQLAQQLHSALQLGEKVDKRLSDARNSHLEELSWRRSQEAISRQRVAQFQQVLFAYQLLHANYESISTDHQACQQQLQQSEALLVQSQARERYLWAASNQISLVSWYAWALNRAELSTPRDRTLQPQTRTSSSIFARLSTLLETSDPLITTHLYDSLFQQGCFYQTEVSGAATTSADTSYRMDAEACGKASGVLVHKSRCYSPRCSARSGGQCYSLSCRLQRLSSKDRTPTPVLTERNLLDSTIAQADRRKIEIAKSEIEIALARANGYVCARHIEL